MAISAVWTSLEKGNVLASFWLDECIEGDAWVVFGRDASDQQIINSLWNSDELKSFAIKGASIRLLTLHHHGMRFNYEDILKNFPTTPYKSEAEYALPLWRQALS